MNDRFNDIRFNGFSWINDLFADAQNDATVHKDIQFNVFDQFNDLFAADQIVVKPIVHCTILRILDIRINLRVQKKLDIGMTLLKFGIFFPPKIIVQPSGLEW